MLSQQTALAREAEPRPLTGPTREILSLDSSRASFPATSERKRTDAIKKDVSLHLRRCRHSPPMTGVKLLLIGFTSFFSMMHQGDPRYGKEVRA